LAKIKSLDEIAAVRMYLARIGAEPRSLRTAVIKEVAGSYWRDVAIITLTKEGEIQCPDNYAPTDAEAIAIKNETALVDWPRLNPQKRLERLPDDVKKAKPEDIFEFRGIDDKVVMLQVRQEFKDGTRAYIPWTYWDDREWRKMEPDGMLPLWGLEELKDHATVFVHEGAKAARYVRWMVSRSTPAAKKAYAAHPWAEELSAAAHLGWIGGAMSPYRTDWGVLKKAGVKRVYIVSDNDAPGVAAVSRIAYHLRLPAFHLQFTNEWPAAFDLADPFPASMFRDLEGTLRYVGPAFRACLHPATWATDLVPNPKGKPSPVLRECFKEMWSYVEEADLFVCVQMPDILRPDKILNRMLAGFSHTYDTCRLIVSAYKGRNTKLCYRPDSRGLIVTDKTTSAINLHTPSLVRSEEGNPKPFLDFLTYLFPNEGERVEIERWAATLIARPDVRMEYGLLLVSEATGVGKTTFGSAVLAPLVGVQNVSWPSEGDIVGSDFNGWCANKRLVIIGEIYSGHSWKAYNKLKTLITDTDIQVNEKFMRPYTIENWCHIIACSNSMRALKMEEDDRRWFYPEVTEIRWSREKFVEFRKWLGSGGLGIIKSWALGYGNYITPGQRAPMTARKHELIEGSRSKEQTEAAVIASAMADDPKPVAITQQQVSFAIRAAINGPLFDSDYELRKAMVESGAVVWKKRVKIDGRMQYVLMNRKLADILSTAAEGEVAGLVKRYAKRGGEILDPGL
jgi:hypothetical protein